MDQFRVSRRSWNGDGAADSGSGSRAPHARLSGNRLSTTLRSSGSLCAPAFAESDGLVSLSWAVPLSLQEFCDRAKLLCELEIPCVFFVNNTPVGAISCGVIDHLELVEGCLELASREFRLSLHETEIDSIWLVNATRGAGSAVSVEILGRFDGRPIFRILGLEDGTGAAVWRDVMGNPSLSVD